MATKITFGTDGWRAIIAQDFTTENVARVAEATALWLLKKKKNPSAVVGHDCRFGGELFAETVARTLATAGVKVFLANDFVSTPMVSLGTIKFLADAGIVITASHNPPGYNGYKLKGSYGGPLLPEMVQEVELLIPEKSSMDYAAVNTDGFISNKMIEKVDLETLYFNHVCNNFDLNTIKKSGLKFAYDAMYGAGQNIMRRLLPGITLLHCDYNPSFMGQPPEPLHKNLMPFSELIRTSGNIDCGLATDGDADRLGMYGPDGNFIDSHHIILLLIHYFCKYKGLKGKVATAFSTTVKIKKICAHYGLELEVVPIGFKHICAIMITEDVLLGGEESGGIAISSHIPERDGVWIGLTIWEFMAKSGKKINELIKEVYSITGPFAFERSDLHLAEKKKLEIVENCKKGNYRSFGKYNVKRIEDLDGWKYFLSDDEWLMIRASGTEPILRTYAESSTSGEAKNILNAAYKTLMDETH